MVGRAVLDVEREQVELDERPTGVLGGGSTDVAVRRTFRSSPTRTWNLVASPEGAAAWLGEAPDPWWEGTHGGPVVGDLLQAPGGECYEVRSAVSGTRIRLQTLGPLQVRSTVQLTLDAAEGRTTVALLQEGLPDPELREAMRAHWTHALDRIEALLADG